MSRKPASCLIEIPLYRSEFHVVCIDELEEELEALGVNVEAWHASGCSAGSYSAAAAVFRSIPVQDGRYIEVMALPKKHDEYVLWHESLHMAWVILDGVGAQMGADNHEPLAYLQGWVASEVKRRFYNRTK